MELINVDEPSRAWTVNKKKFKKFSRMLKQSCIVLNQTGDRLDCTVRQPKNFKQGFLVLQLFLEKGKAFSVELKVAEALNSRRTLTFTTQKSDLAATHERLVISAHEFPTGEWTNVCINVSSYAPLLSGFAGLVAISLHSHCRIGRVFFARRLSTQAKQWQLKTQVIEHSPLGEKQSGNTQQTPEVLARFSSTRTLPKIELPVLRRASATVAEPSPQLEISESIHVSDESTRETAGSTEKTLFTQFPFAATPRQLSLETFKAPNFYESAVQRLTQIHCQSPLLFRAT